MDTNMARNGYGWIRRQLELLVSGCLLAAMLPLAIAQEPAGDVPYIPTVLITGANRGLGLEFTRQYVDRGWRVIATARRPEAADDLIALAGEHPGLVMIEKLDVQEFDAIDALSEKYADTPIDILINNAGINGGARNQIFRKLQYEVYEDVLLTNTIAPLKMSEAFYDNLLAGQQKKIVTVSSSEGSIGSATQARLYFYRSSKAAVNMVMVNLALQLKRRGISVGMVNPGPTDTDFMAGLPKSMLRPPSDAVTDMIRNIDGLNLETTGTFWQYDGTTIPW
ncbi:MAG: SDR family oxidoreductase [Gammaproteobacteria bacterium]|jgi:NAD(P)-dependent dehydrogenase (short-subunit alcohol dehydrogenase family)|nr:SDR family oxidoreductase [Gammaproteobacteria bacterium]